MSGINRRTSLQELAALVSQALEAAGIAGTLSGGGAVSVYTENEYESRDLDFITSERNSAITKALEPLGFRNEAGRREFDHPDTDYYVEFPSGPLAFGETIVSDNDATTLQTDFGPIRIITPTQSVMDRLAAYFAWNDNQAFDQAVMIAGHQPVDWTMVREWSEREGRGPAVIDKLRKRAGRD